MSFIARILRISLFLPEQASTVAAQIDWLHFVVIIITMLGAGGIALVAAVFCVRYRKPHDRKFGAARPPAPAINLWTEVSVIGGLFTLFVLWWAAGFWQYIELTEPPANSYDIYVSAKQWMWKFAYPDGSHTVDTLYVPVAKPVRLIMTSRDVIHSFYVPDFRVKHDVLPARYTTVWFNVRLPGTHRIFCAEYCGTWHSRMLGQVVALTERDFAHWLRHGEREHDYPLDPDLPQVSAGESSLVTRGQQVAAAYGCLRCHSVDGSPHIGPTWAGLYDAKVPLENGQTVVADVAYLTESMMDPHAKIHRGFAAVMPSYIGYLKPPEVGALVSYIKSLSSVSTAATPVPAQPPGTGSYQPPKSTPTRKPEPAGEIGMPAGQQKRSEELLQAQPEGTGPSQSGVIESAPNPLPRGTPAELRQQMGQHTESNQNGRQP